jgi:membrane-anchored protein YejM (alkaline phosphatase superfamily)
MLKMVLLRVFCKDETKISYPGEVLVLCLILIFFGFWAGLTLNLVFNYQLPPSWIVVKSGNSNLSITDALRFMSLSEWIMLLLPAFVLVTTGNKMIFTFIKRLALVSFLAGIVSMVMYQKIIFSKLDPAFIFSPGAYTAYTSWVQKPPNFLDKPLSVTPEQAETRNLIDPTFISATPNITESAIINKTEPKKWNVVLFVIESFGYPYFNDTKDGEMAMPFFNSLKEKGLLATQHYSTSNNTPGAVFSIYSGLNHYPEPIPFVSQKSLKLPSLKSLCPDYDVFLVTPTRTNFFFTRGMLVNDGVRIVDFDSIPADTKRPDVYVMDRHEAVAVDALIKEIHQSKKPFFAVYNTFLPHFNYDDYGAEYHVRKDTKEKYSKYLSNLRVLDLLLKKLVEDLEKEHLMENTIFMVVGDHGEAFNQHDYEMHGNNVYNETIRVPLLMYQPQLFPAQELKRKTSHPDIIPTIADALQIKVPFPVQGESIFQPSRIKYAYNFGYDGSIATIRYDGLKVIFDAKKRQVMTFDLKKDPDEKTPIESKETQSVLDDLNRFYYYQTSALKKSQKQ